MKKLLIYVFFITLIPFSIKSIENSIIDSIEAEIVFAYIPSSVKKCFLSIQDFLEDSFIVENNDKNCFYDLCNLLEYDSKVANYYLTLAAVEDPLNILKNSHDLFSYRKTFHATFQSIIDSLDYYKKSLLAGKLTITINSTGIKISQNLKNTTDDLYIINLPQQDIAQLLVLYKQKLYRSPRLNNEQNLPPINSDFLDVFHINSKSINTQDLNICGDTDINGTSNVCGEILLNSLDLETEFEDLLSCCDNHESRLDIIESQVDSITTNTLVFTPIDMSRRGSATPTTTPTDVYGSTMNSYPVMRAWVLGPINSGAASDRRPISFQFCIPNDFDTTGLVEVNTHILVDGGEETTGQTARLQLRVDFKSNNQQLDNSAGGFADNVASDNFTVTKPTLNTALNHQLVAVTMTDSVVNTIEPGDWAYIVLNRLAPTVGTEFNAELYLSSVCFGYQTK